MGLIEAVIYGIVQGLTEWLPISSTAHLRILPALAGWQDPGAGFTAVIQLGTVLAVLIYFGKDLGRAFMGWVRSFTPAGRGTEEAKMGWAIFVGTIPIVLIGFLARDFIKSDQTRSLYVVAGSLILMGIVMLIAERVGKRERGIETVQPKDGLWVGLWQCIALIPGMSRSGSTISGALFAGFDKATAARFSFLLSVPSILAAGVFELFESRKQLLAAGIAPTLVATFVSFVVGYASIAWLIKYLQRRGIGVFVGYRILLAALLIFLLQTGRIHPLEGTASEPPAAASIP